MAAECRVFGDNSAVEFHKLRRRIWQDLPQKNGALKITLIQDMP